MLDQSLDVLLVGLELIVGDQVHKLIVLVLKLLQLFEGLVVQVVRGVKEV